MKLKIVFVSLAIALAQITPSDAQSISPAGHYTKKRGGPGEMWVEKAGAEWRIFVDAAGVPRPRGLTAADCALIFVGVIEGNTFQGEAKYFPDPSKLYPNPTAGSPELVGAQRQAVLDYLKGGSSEPSWDAVQAGHKITITFAPQSATLPDGPAVIEAGCPDHTGLFGRYTKDQKR
jgi:hypothetical protein